jgi:site-specific DNA recombinase
MQLALYVRVSTTRQTQTIDQQLTRLLAHVERHNWTLEERHIYRDDGYSGASLTRPGLDALRDRVTLAEIDLLLLTAPDRLARNYVHQVLLLEEFQRGGCRVEFLEHPMSQDPHDQLLLQIRGAVAEYERTLIAERMRRGRLQKLQTGALLPWTRAPYGYRTDPDRPRDPKGVRIEAGEAAVIAEIYATYLEGNQSLCGLTTNLTRRGIPTLSGRVRWNQSTVYDLLTNPAYAGMVYAGRTRCVDAQVRQSALRPVGYKRASRMTPSTAWIFVAHVPPIVSQDQFDAVQAKLAYHRRFARRHNMTHPYLLRNLVSCGLCRLACGGCAKGPYRYYICRGKGSQTQSCRDERCPARFIPASQLDEIVWQDVCELLCHPAQIEAALRRARWRLAAARTAGSAHNVAESRQESGAAARAAHPGVSRGCAGVGRVPPSQGRAVPAGRGSAKPGTAIAGGSTAPAGIDRHGGVAPGLLPTGPTGARGGELCTEAADRGVVNRSGRGD